jgi:hypothetical protein
VTSDRGRAGSDRPHRMHQQMSERVEDLTCKLHSYTSQARVDLINGFGNKQNFLHELEG